MDRDGDNEYSSSGLAGGEQGGNQQPPQQPQPPPLFPTAPVVRIMRQVLPPRTMISEAAKQTVTDCATEFIGFVTTEANERCKRENRCTVTADDLLWALENLGYDNYAQVLTLYLHRLRQQNNNNNNNVSVPLPPVLSRAPPPVTSTTTATVAVVEPKGKMVDESGGTEGSSSSSSVEDVMINNLLGD
ncbi:hypothetical protein RIF29_18118 [Crotalaria pallida]|uniref:Transcription factor CBF/NF-Y/archaeal histone domain-containing protein n=1 Tax=Crotalaria pallida TaxID=3830 RepID=A0AAN9IFY1_CROPI